MMSSLAREGEKNALSGPVSTFILSLLFNSSSIIAAIRLCKNLPRRCSSRPRLGEAGGDPYVYTDLGKSVHRCDRLGGPERPRFSQKDLWILGRGANFSRPVPCFHAGRMEMGERFESRGPWIV